VLPADDSVGAYPATLSFTGGGQGPNANAPGTEIFAVLYQPEAF
jgi:hypothetical protein